VTCVSNVSSMCERMQDGRTSDLIFDPGFLVSYISTFITLEPGDLILTGTPSGVGFKRNPPQFLKDGQNRSDPHRGNWRAGQSMREGS